jgi:hypothetical protein
MHCMWGGNRILIAGESCMTWKRERAKVKKLFAFAVTKEQPFYLADTDEGQRKQRRSDFFDIRNLRPVF